MRTTQEEMGCVNTHLPFIQANEMESFFNITFIFSYNNIKNIDIQGNKCHENDFSSHCKIYNNVAAKK